MSSYSNSQEYRIANVWVKHGLKAFRVPLSGACAAIGKGDVNVEDGKVLIDHKSTRGKDSISIKREDLEKIKVDAKEGTGIVTFSYKNCRTLYAILPLEELIKLYKNLWYNKSEDISTERK